MNKVTIEDISRQTGLSRGTVSRALNDRPDISAATKERVLEACLKLNYIPSHAARSLATGRNFAIAVLLPDLRCSFSAAVLRGAIARADAAQYVVHVLELGTETRTQALKFRLLSSERIDSVLLAAPLSDSALAELRERLGNRPIVTCHGIQAGQFDTFCADDREAGRLAARRLARAGKVVFLRPAQATDAVQLRAQGAAETLTAGEDSIVSFDVSHAQLDELIRDASGIVAADVATAVQAMLACSAAGRTPGRDVAVIAIGDEPIAARLRPSITTIDLAAEDLGRNAVDRLLHRLTDGQAEKPEKVTISPRLIERETTQHLPQQ